MKRTVTTVAVTVVAAAFLLVLGHNMEVAESWRPLRRALRGRSVPSPLLEYGALGGLLRRHGLVTAVPNDGSLFPRGAADTDVTHLTPFQKKRREGAFLLQANPGGKSGIRSSRVVDPVRVATGFPCVSLWVAKDAFHDPETGIMANWKERGREWERLAFMSYFEDGKLSFASGVGLRIHGYKSNRWRRNSFRLYFRSEYGTDPCLPTIFEGAEGGGVRTLVLRRDRHHLLLFMNSMAFDVLGRAGVATPRNRPVMTFLNGRYRGIYCLSEHLSRRQWRANLGHDDFAFYNKRSSSDEASIREYYDLLEWAKTKDDKATTEEAEKRVDLDAMSRQLLVCMYLGLTDWKQGVAIRDRAIPESRWSWIAWDLDNSFVDLSSLRAAVNWRGKAASLVFGKNWLKHGKTGDLEEEPDVRRALFCRLWEECPDYRRTFLRLATDLLNHEINERFLIGRWRWYFGTMDAVGARVAKEEQFLRLETFFRNRHVFLRKDLRAYAEAGDLAACTVTGPAGTEYRIDGYPERGTYRGLYYAGQRISVEAAGRGGRRIASWLVNGQNVPGTKLSVVVERETVIEPVFRRRR